MPPVRGLILSDVLEIKFKPTIGITTARLEKLGLSIRSFREPLKRAVQQVMIPSFRMNFESGGRPAWTPLADYTVQQRGSSEPILVRGGSLMRVVTQLNLWDIDAKQAVIPDLPQKVWYGKVHQGGYGSAGGGRSLSTIVGLGASARKVYIPQRQFIMLQDEDYDGVEEVFAKWLGERIALSGAYKVTGL